jgi:hypothetical protein
MKRIHYILLILLCLSITVRAQDSSSSSFAKKLIPTGVQGQFAGNIGMVSFGPNWNLYKKKLHLEYSFGVVPENEFIKPIYSSALKLRFTPWKINIDDKTHLYPVSLGIGINYTFGERYSKYNNISQYERGYYWWTTAKRFGCFYQIEISRSFDTEFIKEAGLYFESSIWDLDLYKYSANENYKELSFMELLTLGAGFRIYF